jgi:hypothetical protein
MPSIRHLSQAVECLLTECLPDLSRAARQRLLFALIGVLVAGSIVLRRVATTQAHLSVRSVCAASHERRLRRMLTDPQLGSTEPHYSRVVRRVLKRLPSTRRVWVVLDESGHTTVVRVLLAALVYRGRAVPLAWKLWGAYLPHEQTYWRDCGELLTQVAACLPSDLKVTVLADRAFGCPGFTDLVTALGWQVIVRVQGQTRLRSADGTERALRSLLERAGQRWCGSGQVFKNQGWRSVSVVAYWRQGCSEPLLLVSTTRAHWDVVRQYRLRSTIEALFRDWKSSGWQWEASQVRRVAHQQVLVLVLALATLLTLCLGEEAAAELLAQEQQAGQRRPWHARDSLFRLGRDRLWQRVWQNDQRPLVWELGNAAAQPWSQEYWQAARPATALVYQTERLGKREQVRQPSGG